MSTAESDEHEMTVAELLQIVAKKGQATKTATVAIDLPANPGVFNEPIMIVFSFGKEARNNMARILNTFLEMKEDEHG